GTFGACSAVMRARGLRWLSPRPLRARSRRCSQLGIDLVDRAAARLHRDQPKSESAENVPGGEIGKARDQCVEGCLRAVEIGLAGDQRQSGWADELAEIADAVDQAHAA